MATHQSSKKRARQAIKRRLRNRTYVASVRTAIKSFRTAAAAGQGVETLTNLFKSAQVALAKAAQKGLIHGNNASRNISRLAKSLKAVSAAPAAAAEKTKTAKKAPAKASGGAKKKPAAKKSSAKSKK